MLVDNKTDYLVIEYNGEAYQRFYHLVKHLFKTLEISKYHIYEGKDIERLQIFIEVDQLTLVETDVQLEKLSSALNERVTKNWKCLPSSTLPIEYNIVTLPYKRID